MPSSCSVVLGPTTVLVTPGRCRSQASATWAGGWLTSAHSFSYSVSCHRSRSSCLAETRGLCGRRLSLRPGCRRGSRGAAGSRPTARARRPGWTLGGIVAHRDSGPGPDTRQIRLIGRRPPRWPGRWHRARGGVLRLAGRPCGWLPGRTGPYRSRSLVPGRVAGGSPDLARCSEPSPGRRPYFR